MSNQRYVLAAVTTAAMMMAGCEADDSVATSPRTVNPYAGLKADDAAAKRALEAPGRTVPTGVSGDAPHQLNEGPAIPGDARVVMLQASPAGATTEPANVPAAPPVASPTAAPVAAPADAQPTGWDAVGHTVGPTIQYNKDNYTGPLPHLPENPGTVPMVGSTPVPGTGWSIDHSWGEVLPLTNYPHRSWPETKAEYETANVKNNPVYFYNVQDHLDVPQNNGSNKSDWKSTAIETPWWYVNTAILPVLMVLEPPLAQRSTRNLSGDPNYNGHLADGPEVKTPEPGELSAHWVYPFMNTDGTVIKTTQPATQPATQP